MTVLLTYHHIAEKEPSLVNPRWKTCTVFSLLAIVFSCLAVSFSLHELISDYKHNCMLDAHLKFIPKTINNTQDNVMDFSQQADDVQYGIDEYWSDWSSRTFCETLENVPLFQGICCIIWLAIVLIHGPGGILPQPWRIVIPSLIFFFACLATAVGTASYITKGLTQLCTEFRKVESVRGLSCARLMLHFALSEEPNSLLPVDKIFFITLVFPWVWVAATCLGFVVILLRIILMVDFQLLRVVVSKHGECKCKDLPKCKLPPMTNSGEYND